MPYFPTSHDEEAKYLLGIKTTKDIEKEAPWSPRQIAWGRQWAIKTKTPRSMSTALNSSLFKRAFITFEKSKFNRESEEWESITIARINGLLNPDEINRSTIERYGTRLVERDEKDPVVIDAISLIGGGERAVDEKSCGHKFKREFEKIEKMSRYNKSFLEREGLMNAIILCNRHLSRKAIGDLTGSRRQYRRVKDAMIL